MRKKTLEYTHFKLENGLDVLLIKRPEKYTVGFTLHLRAGSIYETDKTSGISHYFEHIMFNGTKNFPTERQLREKEIEIDIELGAYTDYDSVVLYGSSPIFNLKSCLRHVKEVSFESIISEKAVQKQKEILLSEEGLRRDNVVNELWDFALKTRFPKENPLNLPREGYPTSIRELGADQIRKAYMNHAVASNTLLVIGSKYDFGKMKKIVEEIFFDVREGKRLKTPNTSKISNLTIFAKTRDLNQVYFALNFPYFPPQSLVERWKSSFVVELLGENLYRRLVLDEGLVYTSSAIRQRLTSTTELIYISMVCRLGNLRKVSQIIFEEIRKAKNQGYDEKLFEKFRGMGNRKLPMNYDSLATSMNWTSSSFFDMHKVYSPEEVVEARNKVTLENLRETASKIFDFKNLNAVSYGPLKQKELDNVIHELIRLA